MIRLSRLLRTPVDELLVVGSRWTRLTAKALPKVNEPASQPFSSQTPEPFITIIPTLHVASIEFYDRVLAYMSESVKQRKNVVILLEGVCDSEEGEVLQMQEFFEISRNEELKATMIEKANKNTIYDEQTVRAICEELAVNFDALVKNQEVRLQECYLKPKMAALVGEYLRNDADLNMKEIEAILVEHGESNSRIPMSRVGSHSAVRRQRENKVANAARMRCLEWSLRHCDGEVIVPWGFYHTAGIKHSIMALNAKSDEGGEENVVFVEGTGTVCVVPFGISKELLSC